MKAKSLFAVTALTLASMAAMADPSYQVIDLGAAGLNSQGFAISQDGSYTMGRTLAGTSGYPGWTAAGSSRADWTMNSSQPFLSPVGGGVNNAGVSVGAAGTTTFGSNAVPVMYKNGAVSNLTMPAGYTTGAALDINNSGTAVGQVGTGTSQRAATFNTFSGTSNIITTTSASGSYMTQAKSINDNGWVIGSGLDVNGKTVGLIDTGGSTLTELGVGIIPTGLNEYGEVVGTDSNTGHSFTWTKKGGYVDTGITGSGSGVNDDGWIIGKTGTGSNQAFLNDGTGTYSIDSILTNGTGWSFTGSSVMMSGIADNGYIIGTALYNGVAHAVLLAPVPEPATWALMLAGIAGVGAIARRRQAAAQA